MKVFKKGSLKLSATTRMFDRISTRITRATGSAAAFFTALTVIIVWSVTGPLFNYSDTWQLFINTSTTIITFLMVFVIQQSQNKDTTAIQLKLNELIACNEKASNHLIAVEDLTDQELQLVKRFYLDLARMADKDADVDSTYSLHEAERNQAEKSDVRKKRKIVSKAEANHE